MLALKGDEELDNLSLESIIPGAGVQQFIHQELLKDGSEETPAMDKEGKPFEGESATAINIVSE